MSNPVEGRNKRFLQLKCEGRRRTYSEGYRVVHDTVSNAEKLMYASNPDFAAVSLMDLREKDQAASTSLDEPTLQNPTRIVYTVRTTVRTILNAFDFSLFRKPIFILITGFSHFAIIVRLMDSFIPARAQELGLEQSDAALLLMIIGCLDFVFRIVYGFLADLKILKVHQIMIIGLVCTGVTCLCMPLFNTFNLLVVFCVIFGIFGSTYQCLIPVVIIDFIGIDYMAKTLGFLALFHGLSAAVTYPILGFITDYSGSYSHCFQYLGTAAIIAAAMLMCEPVVTKYNTQVTNDNARNRELTV